VAGTSGAQAGGIGGLVAFLRDHGKAVEADLQRFYGIALSDLPSGRLTWRRLTVLLAGLPRESATAREVGGADLEWGLAEQLMAGMFDALQVANWQRTGNRRNRPKPIPRPGVRDGADRVGKTDRSPEQVKAFLARIAPKAEVNDGD
jgi:hypothetical protein